MLASPHQGRPADTGATPIVDQVLAEIVTQRKDPHLDWSPKLGVDWDADILADLALSWYGR